MSDNQWRVLWILLAAFGMELFFNPLSASIVLNAGTLLSPTVNGQAPNLNKAQSLISQIPAAGVGLLFYAVGVIILLALADVMPSITTMIAFLILLTVIFKHGNQLSGAFNTAYSGLQSLRSGG